MDKTQKRIVYYKMACGCLCERSDLVRIDSKLYCPEHKSRINSKLSKCIQCGQEIKSKTLTSNVPFRCVKCNPRRVIKGKSQEKIKKIKKPKRRFLTKDAFVEIMMERSVCIYRPLCLVVHFKDNELPCVDCKDFSKTDSINTITYGVDLKKLDDHIEKIFITKSQAELRVLNNTGLKFWGSIFEKRKKDLWNLNNQKNQK